MTIGKRLLLDSDTFDKSMGKVLNELRHAERLATRPMALKLDIPYSRLRKYELGEAPISAYDALIITKYFGLDIVMKAQDMALKELAEAKRPSMFDAPAIPPKSPFGDLVPIGQAAPNLSQQEIDDFIANNPIPKLRPVSSDFNPFVASTDGPYLENHNSESFEVDEELGNLTDAQLRALNEAETLKYMSDDDEQESLGNKYL